MMKKKIVLGMGMLFLLASLTACGKTGDGKESSAASNSASNVEKSVEEGSQEKKEDKKTDNEYSALADKYAEDFKFEYVEENFNFSIMMMWHEHGVKGFGYHSLEPVHDTLVRGNCGELYVTQYSGDVGADDHKELCDISKYQDSTDIFDLLVPLVGTEWKNAEITDYTYEIVETKEINGFEMTKFKGEIHTYQESIDSARIYPTVAYGVAGTKTPVFICFMDGSEDQSSIEEWMEKIDYVASTYKELD